MSQHLRKLPKVDRLLAHPRLAELELRRSFLRRLVVDAIARERARVLEAVAAEREPNPPVPELEAFALELRAHIDLLLAQHPRQVLNATGVLLHTNLGRAPLSAEARAAVSDAGGCCELELDLATGKRGSRMAFLRPLLSALFEAEDAHVVNNGAAALLLACTALSQDPSDPGRATREGGIILSRGQHVEIGDSFRVAEMAAAGGVPLLPVGSTNRTHLRDYAAALDAHPHAVILWVHQSNFVQSGFVREVELSALAELARARKVPLIADLGSGSLGLGVPELEPTVARYIQQGVQLVTFSGDKLLSGPQAGLLAGDADAISRCRRHPLARAMRCGKLALAALHTTAVAHTASVAPALPLHQMIAAQPDDLRARGERLCSAMGWDADATLRVSQATIGGGSLPGQEIESLALVPPGPAARWSRALRSTNPPMIARAHDGRLWIDLRSLALDSDDHILSALRGASPD